MVLATITTAAVRPPRRAAIVGGSLGGLAAAHALLNSVFEWQTIDVYERAAGPLATAGSGLGFVHVPAWEALCQGMPMMRRRTRAHRAQGSFYYGDLWNYLYQGLPEGTVKFGKMIEQLKMNENEQGETTISIENEPYDLVILADGGFSKLRKHVLEADEGDSSTLDTDTKSNNSSSRYQQQPEYAGYAVWRGHVSASKVPHSVLQEMEEGVYKDGVYDTIVLKMAKDSGEDLWTMGTFIETPENKLSQYWNKATDGASRQHKDNTTAAANNEIPTTPGWFMDHFRTHFHHVPGLVNLMNCMIQHGDISPHPQYEFGAIERVHRDRILLLGDAAHMASPRTAVGAHTAILDALALRQAFDAVENGNVEVALALYSRSGLQRAHELYARSRQVSCQFVSREQESSERNAMFE